MLDNEPFQELLSPHTKTTALNHLAPGATFLVTMIAVGRAGGSSRPSNGVRISCPRRPPAPHLRQEPCYTSGCVLVAWDLPPRRDGPLHDDITRYSVFVDGQWHADVPTSLQCRTYQYQLTGLLPGVLYDITVKAMVGKELVDSPANAELNQVSCMVESDHSPPLTVTCVAPPASPQLKIEAMGPDGLELSWDPAQSFGEAETVGYQLLRDTKPYGAVIPPDVTSLCMRDITMGERISLQLVALTNHPVGRATDARHDSE